MTICRPRRRNFTLVELLVAIGIMVLLISILLPTISRARQAAKEAKLRASALQHSQPAEQVKSADPPAAVLNPAQIESFGATIGLTPRLSVGTAEPESIYEAHLQATVTARAAPKSGGESEIELPLPPQVISLGDVSISVDGIPSNMVSIRDDKLVWRGPLPLDKAATLVATYSAVGKGLYTLATPSGRILDQFKVQMSAHGSDVRMLELSLQPTSLDRSSGLTKYVWDYKRLMFGRPIALDVLGIAPLDRLGELRWLGPLSVLAFGVVLGFTSRANHAANFDRWLLLLVLGLFSGAYPLMYFAQEFISLRVAMLGIGAAVPVVLTLHLTRLIGFKQAVLGVALPAALIMAITLLAATNPNLQGILLTALALGMFMLGMRVAPRLQADRLTPSPAI